MVQKSGESISKYSLLRLSRLQQENIRGSVCSQWLLTENNRLNDEPRT
jgi:hypothetical protein